jgi:hypothetical protein
MAEEKRRLARMALSLPVRVQGHEPEGKAWEEMSTTHDASVGGVALTLRHKVEFGQVLHLSLPLPKHFRQYDLTEASYRTYGLVRGTRPDGNGWQVGVKFLGKVPPRGYLDNPGGVFLLPTDGMRNVRIDRRRWSRLQIHVNVKLEWADPADGTREEITVTEDVGLRGVRVPTSLPISKGETLLLREVGGTFVGRAEVRAVVIGKDHIPRLNLYLLDGDAPSGWHPAVA